MSASSDIVVNIVDSSPNVPNTGQLTDGVGSIGGIVATISIVMLVSLIVLGCFKWLGRSIKTNRTSNAMSITNSTRRPFRFVRTYLRSVKNKKCLVVNIFTLMLLMSVVTFIIFKTSSGQDMVNAANTARTMEDNALSVTTSGVTLDIEVVDNPVYALAEDTIVVNNATEAGYTLLAYADSNTDGALVSTTNPSSRIANIEGGSGMVLSSNTWGLATVLPTSKDDAVFHAVPTSLDTAMTIKDTGYRPSEAGEETSVYYGFYVTPDLPYDTYTGVSVNYVIIANPLATITFDGNGLYFDNEKTQNTNTAKYRVVNDSTDASVNTYNELYSGTYMVPKMATGNIFLGWDKNPEATVATYTSETDIINELKMDDDEEITLYAIWTPIFNIQYDGNGAAGEMVSDGIALSHPDVMLGSNITLYAPNYKKPGYGFIGWSTDSGAWSSLTDNDTTNDPIIYGPNQSIVVDKNMSTNAAIAGSATLYAIWAPAEMNNNIPIYLQNWTGCSELTATTYDVSTNTLTVG